MIIENEIKEGKSFEALVDEGNKEQEYLDSLEPTFLQTTKAALMTSVAGATTIFNIIDNKNILQLEKPLEILRAGIIDNEPMLKTPWGDKRLADKAVNK